MRWIVVVVVVVLAGCASAPRQVACRGTRLELPASLVVLHRTATELLAASPDTAVIVRRDGGAADRATTVDQISDADRPVYRYAYRHVDGCTFRAVALLPATTDGAAIAAAVAGTDAETWLIGSPRVASAPPLAILLRMVGAQPRQVRAGRPRRHPSRSSHVLGATTHACAAGGSPVAAGRGGCAASTFARNVAADENGSKSPRAPRSSPCLRQLRRTYPSAARTCDGVSSATW